MSFASLGLSLGVGRAIGSAQNIIAKRLTTETFQAAAKEAKGITVALRADGKPFDHIGALKEALSGLNNQSKVLNNALKAGNLSNEGRDVIKSNLRQINSAAKGIQAFFKKHDINY